MDSSTSSEGGTVGKLNINKRVRFAPGEMGLKKSKTHGALINNINQPIKSNKNITNTYHRNRRSNTLSTM